MSRRKQDNPQHLLSKEDIMTDNHTGDSDEMSWRADRVTDANHGK